METLGRIANVALPPGKLLDVQCSGGAIFLRVRSSIDLLYQVLSYEVRTPSAGLHANGLDFHKTPVALTAGPHHAMAPLVDSGIAVWGNYRDVSVTHDQKTIAWSGVSFSQAATAEAFVVAATSSQDSLTILKMKCHKQEPTEIDIDKWDQAGYKFIKSMTGGRNVVFVCLDGDKESIGHKSICKDRHDGDEAVGNQAFGIQAFGNAGDEGKESFGQKAGAGFAAGGFTFGGIKAPEQGIFDGIKSPEPETTEKAKQFFKSLAAQAQYHPPSANPPAEEPGTELEPEANPDPPAEEPEDERSPKATPKKGKRKQTSQPPRRSSRLSSKKKPKPSKN